MRGSTGNYGQMMATHPAPAPPPPVGMATPMSHPGSAASLGRMSQSAVGKSSGLVAYKHVCYEAVIQSSSLQ